MHNQLLRFNSPKSLTPKPATSSNPDLMKFLQQKPEITNKGKICYPKQKFGVSSESPTYFHLREGLVAENGYNYHLDNSEHKDKFKYLSQKHFVSLEAGQKFPVSKQKNKFTKEFQNAVEVGGKSFNRRKGRLSDFIDKNGWMGNRYKVLGIQRSQQARQLRQSLKQKQISNKTKSIGLSNKTNSMKSLRAEKNKQEFIGHMDFQNMLIAEKLKIAESHKQLSVNSVYHTEVPRNSTQQRPVSMLSQRIPLQTSIFKSTTSKFKPKSSQKQQFLMNIPEWDQQEFKINFIEWDKKGVQDQYQAYTSKMGHRPSTISTGSRTYRGF